MTRGRGKPRNDEPKDEWKSYQPRKRTPRDYETNAAILEVSPPNLSERQKARHIVACHSKNTDEAKEFMHMLGIYPEPSEVPPKRKRKITPK